MFTSDSAVGARGRSLHVCSLWFSSIADFAALCFNADVGHCWCPTLRAGEISHPFRYAAVTRSVVLVHCVTAEAVGIGAHTSHVLE